MVKPIDSFARAARELEAAAQAMRNALALFETIAYAEGNGDVERIDTMTLARIGVEMIGQYAERAQSESEWFEEARNA